LAGPLGVLPDHRPPGRQLHAAHFRRRAIRLAAQAGAAAECAARLVEAADQHLTPVAGYASRGASGGPIRRYCRACGARRAGRMLEWACGFYAAPAPLGYSAPGLDRQGVSCPERVGAAVAAGACGAPPYG